MTREEKKKAYRKISKEELIDKLIEAEFKLKMNEDFIAELNKKYELVDKE